ncbi:MAG: DUF1850 domain-containing protein [Tissierellia bacterium]|nr:DUF1850 domain-containing protein [Tissierellia bacterium]
MRNRELASKIDSMRRSGLLIAAIAILITLLLPIDILQASNHRTGAYLTGWKVRKGDRFHIEYIHSIQLTPVIESYYIDEYKQIILEESYFHSYGAGLPSETPYEFEITKDGFRIYGIEEVMDDLVYRTGAIRANHEIFLRGKAYPFLGFSEPGEGVKFEMKKVPLLQYIAKEVYNVAKQTNNRE